MFEKYNTKNLFFATIIVKYSDDDYNHINSDGIIIIDGNGPTFDTVLLKHKKKYIDLKHPNLNIVKQRDPKKTSFVIQSLKPFSDRKENIGKIKIMTKYKTYKKESTRK